jgi:hypothetical protein
MILPLSAEKPIDAPEAADLGLAGTKGALALPGLRRCALFPSIAGEFT